MYSANNPYGLNTRVEPKIDRPTWPPPGTATIYFKQSQVLLFYSTEWVIQAVVDEKVMFESKSSSQIYSSGAAKQWARKCLRDKYEQFKELGVDVEKTYASFGGLHIDLNRTF